MPNMKSIKESIQKYIMHKNKAPSANEYLINIYIWVLMTWGHCCCNKKCVKWKSPQPKRNEEEKIVNFLRFTMSEFQRDIAEITEMKI